MGCLQYESFSESDSVTESQQLLVDELDQLKQLISKMVQNDGSESDKLLPSYNADYEDCTSETDHSQLQADSISNKEKKCIICKRQSTKITHCDKCWKIRKEWLPYAEKKNKKKRSAVNKGMKVAQSISVSSEGRENCIMCYQRPKNVALVHGKIGHQVIELPTCFQKKVFPFFLDLLLSLWEKIVEIKIRLSSLQT